MKKKLMSMFALSLCALLTFVSCNGDKATQVKGFELDAFVNAEANDEYDSSLFYRNDLKVFGGDADIIWVSEEQGGEEYGGWFYMYTSGNDGVAMDHFDDHKEVITCLRSRDMNDWELCGNATGTGDSFCCYLEKDSWPQSHAWAPEVIYNPTDGRYYMYYNVLGPWHTDDNDPDNEFNLESENMFDRFYGAVFMSDTPVGPFVLATSERYYGNAKQENPNGKIITDMTPQINVTKHFGLDEVFSVIDFSPFFDVNGDLYLYFVRHVSTGHDHNCLWGVKMKDMITPDYDTLTMLAQCNYRYVEKTKVDAEPWEESAYTFCEQFATSEYESTFEGYEGYVSESAVNEGPQMVYHDGRYYLVYSPRGFDWTNYDATQAIGTSPLGKFEKQPQFPATVMGHDTQNYYMTGTGHQSFVEVNGELFCGYYVHSAPHLGTSATDGRIYAFDRVEFVDVPGYGKLLYGNGPTKSLQPKPSVATGKTNVAKNATVSVSNGNKDQTKYLNDGLFVNFEYFKDWEFEADGATTITLTFDKPTSVNAVMVYNSYDYEYAFSKIDSVQFNLAEKPSWYTAETYSPYAYIKDIPFNLDYVDQVNGYMQHGGSALAAFNEIKVNSIEITISSNLSGKNSKLRISDIVVLGQ